MRCVSRGGNKRLERAMFPSAFTSLRSDPVNQAYYQHKRNPRQSALGQAVLILAHRRIPPLHVSTRNSTSTTHNRPGNHGWAALLAYPAPQQPRSKQCLPIDMAVTSTARTS